MVKAPAGIEPTTFPLLGERTADYAKRPNNKIAGGQSQGLSKGKKKNQNARSGVRTHASEENSTLNCRLGPLGHPCLQHKKEKKENNPVRRRITYKYKRNFKK